MDLEQKQSGKRNKVARLAAIVIAATVFATTAIKLALGIRVDLIVMMVTAIVVIAFNIVAYAQLKHDYKYMHCCCSSMIVLYAIVIIFSRDINMYALVYLIAMLVMLFSDTMLTTAGSAVAIVGVIAFMIKLCVQGYAEASNSLLPVIFTIVGCCIGVFVTSIQNKISKENLEEVASKAEMQMETSKKIIELANALNQKFTSANEVSQNLSESVSTSNNSVSEIASSTKVNAEQIEQQTSKTSDIQQSIQDVGTEASNMGEISERTNATVDEGVKLVEKLKSQAAEVAAINTETKETTEKLNESIQDVQEITKTILGISSQTNLLALNASIEAARAGEAGKGFAVVAEEIRTLSEDTRKATEQISVIIERLTGDAVTASESMARSANVAQKQNELIALTGEKLLDIKNDTDDLHDGVVSVNDSVQNIIAANTVIMDSIQSLSATSQEVAASSDMALSISDDTIQALRSMNELLGDISNISNTMEEVARE